MEGISNDRPIVLSFSLIENQITIEDGEFAGKEYYVVPSIMLVEGAFTPAVSGHEEPAALYFAGEDISTSLHSWNGRPVSLYHPFGSSSCNVPAVMDVQGVGYVFNVRYDEPEKKLRADIWIEKDRGQFIVDKIAKGDKIELSVGAFGDIIEEHGEHNGIAYDQRMTNIIGDHLAILPDVKGACSWEDGCGIRMQNVEQNCSSCDPTTFAKRTIARRPSYSGVESISLEGVCESLGSYLKGYYKATGSAKIEGDSDVSNLTSKAKTWISSKTLLGNPKVDIADDLIFFPVVNPLTNKLNEGALRAVLSGRGAQAKIPSGARESARQMAERLLKSEFGKKETKMEEKVLETTEASGCAEEKVQEMKPVTMQEFLDNAPEELRGTIADAMREREEQRGVLIKAINAYEDVNFCTKFLAMASTGDLKGIATIVEAASKKEEKVAVAAVDYSLQSSVETETEKRCDAPALTF